MNTLQRLARLWAGVALLLSAGLWFHQPTVLDAIPPVLLTVWWAIELRLPGRSQ